MRNLLSCFIYSLRMLRKDADVTAAAILALALGIGANSAIFTVVNAVLIRRLPYPDSDRILQLLHSDKKIWWKIFPPWRLISSGRGTILLTP